jgi:hypothetical protein
VHDFIARSCNVNFFLLLKNNKHFPIMLKVNVQNVSFCVEPKTMYTFFHIDILCKLRVENIIVSYQL